MNRAARIVLALAAGAVVVTLVGELAKRVALADAARESDREAKRRLWLRRNSIPGRLIESREVPA